MNDLPDAHDRADDAEREVRRLEEEVERLKEVLGYVQWRGGDLIDEGCPVCANNPNEGHAPDCRLKAALETPG